MNCLQLGLYCLLVEAQLNHFFIFLVQDLIQVFLYLISDSNDNRVTKFELLVCDEVAH